MNSTQRNTQQQWRHDHALEKADEQNSVAAFEHPANVLEPDVRSDLINRLADALAPVLLFLSKGRLTDTMSLRTWVVLYETRSDLIGGETIALFAKRAGVSAQRVHTLIKEFRSLVPAYRSAHRKPAATVAKMKQTARRNAEAHPPGRKPLSPTSQGTGSAHP